MECLTSSAESDLFSRCILWLAQRPFFVYIILPGLKPDNVDILSSREESFSKGSFDLFDALSLFRANLIELIAIRDGL